MSKITSKSKAMERTIGECCPPFHTEKWDEKTHQWDHKKFIKETVPTLFHIPLPPMIGNRVTKIMKLAEDAKKLEKDKEDILLLFMDPHAFKSDLFLSVTDTVPDADNTTLTGTFISKVYEGDFNDVPKFIKKMDGYLSHRELKAHKYYVHYAYCPKCAKEEGHNYIVLFGELA